MDFEKKVEFEDNLPDEVTVYIDDNGNIYDELSSAKSILAAAEKYPEVFSQSKELENDVEKVRKSLKRKGFEGSLQDISEIRDSYVMSFEDVIDPPFDPNCFAHFLEVDEVHFKACDVKVSDSVCREYVIESKKPISSDEFGETNDEFISKFDFIRQKKEVESFIKRCNRIHGFVGVLRKSCMDHESIGWGAIEVIRGLNKKIARLEHIPAPRLKVLRGWKGFVEERSDGKYTYYQVFGEKVGVYEENPLSGGLSFRPYDPEVDGDIEGDNVVFNYVNKDTGEPTNDPRQAANEILYFPKTHPNTIYYGYSNVVPAVGAILAKAYIRDYLLQFFEHNTVPRYAVIIKGANVTQEYKEMISKYFSENVKGSAHKTLILTLSGKNQKDITVEFKPLDTERKEGDFLETRREKSQEIMTAHGVSQAILGISQNSELGSGRGLSQAEIYKDRVVTPLQDYWEDKLNYMFEVGLGVTDVRLNFNPLDIRDELTQSQMFQIYLSAGVYSINEVRRKLGEPSIPGGDVLFVRIREGSVFKVEDLPELESILKKTNNSESNILDYPENPENSST